MTLSNAERQARWRARREAEVRAARAAKAAKPEAGADTDDVAALRGELAKAKEHIAKLKARAPAPAAAKLPPAGVWYPPTSKPRDNAKPPLDVEGLDVAEVIKLWHEQASEDDRTEFAQSLSDSDLNALLFDASCHEWKYGDGNYADFLFSMGVFEDTDYVKLPPGIDRDELDAWLRSKCGKGIDEGY